MPRPIRISEANIGLDTISASEYEVNREQQLAQLKKELLQDSHKYEIDLIKARYDNEEEKIKSLYRKKLDKEKIQQKLELKDIDERNRKELNQLETQYKLRKKYADKELADRLANLKKEQEAQEEYDQQRQETWKETTSLLKKDLSNIFTKNGISTILGDIKSSFSLSTTTGVQNIDTLITGLSDYAKKLDKTIDNIASYQGRIDTRLLGTGKTFERSFGNQGLSAWVTSVAGMSPFVSQSAIMSNINTLVDKGIAYNVEQRAFLQSISDSISTTFNAANGTLLSLIRLQQQDSTASRLGLEGQLTYYLNAMYQNTEYMENLYSNTLGNIYEATGQLGARESIAFEYQVQKWLGSLYSSGMSQSAIESLSSAIGMLGSGNIAGLSSNTAMQSLLAISASRAGLNYADLLTGGLNAESTNRLMAAIVSYLADIGTSGNNVLRSQYAQLFGMNLSDLKAISNIASQVNSISSSGGTYSSAMSTLFNLASTMGSRLSVGQQLNTMFENVLYTMSAGIAQNPALYALYKASNLLQATTGGIAIPTVSIMGTSVDLNTTVADLMRVGALSSGILSSIGQMISGLGGGTNANAMLARVLSGGATTLSRGTGLSTLGATTSISSYVGNVEGSDIYQSTLASVAETKKEQLSVAQEEQDMASIDDVNNNIINIYNLLSSVIEGGYLKTQVTNYGLTSDSWSR